MYEVCKCKFLDNAIVKPDGINELDPCLYETEAVYTNCIVEISKCVNCGNISVSWRRTDRTQEIDQSDFYKYV